MTINFLPGGAREQKEPRLDLGQRADMVDRLERALSDPSSSAVRDGSAANGGTIDSGAPPPRFLQRPGRALDALADGDPAAVEVMRQRGGVADEPASYAGAMMPAEQASSRESDVVAGNVAAAVENADEFTRSILAVIAAVEKEAALIREHGHSVIKRAQDIRAEFTARANALLETSARWRAGMHDVINHDAINHDAINHDATVGPQSGGAA